MAFNKQNIFKQHLINNLDSPLPCNTLTSGGFHTHIEGLKRNAEALMFSNNNQNSTLLVNKELTRHQKSLNSEKIQQLKELTELCGKVNSGIMGLCASCGKFKFLPRFCNYRHLCHICAKRRARKLFKQLQANISFLIHKQVKGFRTNRLRFLTLTLRTSENPDSHRKFIIKCLNRFLHRKYCQKRIQGCIASIHTEKSKNVVGEYNIHFHTILYSEWLDVRNHKVSCEWAQATKGNGKYVFIEDIKGLNSAVNYISQYLTKDSAFSFEEKVNLFFGKRFFFTYGCFNRGSSKNCLILIEKLLCANCNSEIQFCGWWTEEYQILKEMFIHKPPPQLKIISKFLVNCDSCGSEINPFLSKKGLCEFCYEKTTPQYLMQQLQQKYSNFANSS